MQIFIAVVLVVAAYALGTFPSAAIIAGKKNLDITKVGSGNPGASNVIRNLGWKTGLAVFLLDRQRRQLQSGSRGSSPTTDMILFRTCVCLPRFLAIRIR
ncbi:MAG: hypothetical protein RL388_163 [Actinomycetota bacterium]